MPHRNSPARATVTRLAFLAVVGWALVALTRRHGDEADADAPSNPLVDRLEPETERTVEAARSRPRSRRQRIATSLAFTTLFFAGAAFSAGAGDMLVEAVEDCDAPAAELVAEAESCEAEEAAEAPPAEESTTEESTGDDVSDDAETDAGEGQDAGEESDTGSDSGDSGESDGDAGEEEPDAGEPEPPADGSDDGDSAGDDGGSNDEPGDDDGNSGKGDDGSEPRHEPAGEPVLDLADEDGHDHNHDLDPEASASGSVATVWLHHSLPDPTPVARRLTPAFAKQLRAASERAGVEWETVLAAIRAEGRKGRAPADRAELRRLAHELRDLLRGSDEWHAFLALEGRTAYADRAEALVHYNRAVGLRALVVGLEAAKPRLEDAVLGDSRLDIYAGGRADVESGGIDVRVLVLLRYLAEQHGQVTVSSLHSGHRMYSRPGVVSAHVYGLAVDIAALGGRSILGNSAPGGVTEEAVRDILLLPAELRPKQVISLLGLGGPSFPMENHADHIHVGY